MPPDEMPQRMHAVGQYWANDHDLLGSRDVIGHVMIGLALCGFLLD